MEHASFTEARLGIPPNEANIKHILGPSLSGDMDPFYAYLTVDKAHTAMLAEQEILTDKQAAAILELLQEILDMGWDEFPIDPKYDTFLLQVERYMIERIGENIAGRMHTGRSRNDQGSAVDRLFARDQMMIVFEALGKLQQTMLDLATKHIETLMPGYTHLQHAQPITFGHYLMRHYHTFERDQQRLEECFARVNLSALGGAAMAGTSWPLDRERTRELLGHDGLVMNSADVGIFDMDFQVEIASVLSIMVNNIGRMAGDFYIWSTYEFGMIEISDGLAGTSSIMPQKKNPHSLERIRGITGMAIGWVPAYQGTVRNASSSDLSLAFSGNPLASIVRDCISVIELMDSTLQTMKVNQDVMEARAAIFWSTTSHLADELVRHGEMSFRIAHHVVGRVVRNAIEAGIPPQGITSDMVDKAAVETIGRDVNLDEQIVHDAFDARGFVYSRTTSGSTHPDMVRVMIEDGKQRQSSHNDWFNSRSNQIQEASEKLEAAIAEIIRRASE